MSNYFWWDSEIFTIKKPALCSSWLKPIGDQIIKLETAFVPDRLHLCRNGATQPHQINSLADVLGVLFVGDTFIADYEGPTTYGMKALHLCRNGATLPHQVNSLTEVLAVLDRNIL